MPESEFLKEVLDIIEELNDRQNSMMKFIKAKQLFWNEPSEERRMLMHEAFETVPHHKKKYVLDARDKKYFKAQGIKFYETVWELDESRSIDSPSAV